MYNLPMKETSLDAASAAAFLKRLGEHIEHNINIMDREGVIIASRDPSRVGSFHDAARRLVATGAAVERVMPGSSLPAGVRPGVNLPVLHRSETVGVVGVTGDPDRVEALAYAVKTSIESMLELQAWKDRALRHQDRKNRLVNLLLYEDETLAAEPLARALGYDPALPRAPLLIAPPRGMEAADALAAVKRCSLHGPQDISTATSEGAVLVLKALSFGDGGCMGAYEDQIRAYADAARSALGGSLPGTWAGAFQSDLGRHRGAYRQLLWLAERYPEPETPPVFLHDHLLEYLTTRIEREELVAALDGPLSLLRPEAIAELAPDIKALSDCGLNLKEAAARLGVHRNTLSARLDRVASLVGRDPRQDPRAMDFLRLLLRYSELQAPVVHGALPGGRKRGH